MNILDAFLIHCLVCWLSLVTVVTIAMLNPYNEDVDTIYLDYSDSIPNVINKEIITV